MKKFFTALFALILLTATAQAAEPVRIARLPILIQSAMPDVDTRTQLEMKIARAVHIPLNDTLQLAEYIPTQESTQILSDLWQQLRAQNKKAKLADAMRPLARALDADIIVCPVLLRYSQYSAPAWDEMIINSYARAELIVYDRRTDELIDKKSSRMYHDSYHPQGTASALAKICFDNVIDATKLRHLIMAIKK